MVTRQEPEAGESEGGWVVVAFLERGKYRVIESEEGWAVQTIDDHGTFS